MSSWDTNQGLFLTNQGLFLTDQGLFHWLVLKIARFFRLVCFFFQFTSKVEPVEPSKVEPLVVRGLLYQKSHLQDPIVAEPSIFPAGRIRSSQMCMSQNLAGPPKKIDWLPSLKLTAIAPENRPGPQRKGLSSNKQFSGASC